MAKYWRIPQQRVAIRLVIGLLLCRAAARADEPAWLTGAAFDRALDQSITATWSQVPFGEAVQSISRGRNVAVLIDRRIDAEALFSLQVPREPLRTAFLRLAAQQKVGASFCRPVVYLGPVETAARLRTASELVREQVANQNARTQAALLRTKRLAWSEAVQPAEIVAQLAEEARLEVRGVDLIPHDLWRAAVLPPLQWIDRLLLVLVQFDLTLTIAADGQSIEIYPLPEMPTIDRRYAAGANPASRLAQLKRMFPQAEFKLENARIAVRASQEIHEEVAALMSGKRSKTTTVENLPETYTLNVERLPLDKVLSQLSGMLKLELTYEEAAIKQAEIALDQLVTFRVKDASLDELLAAALKGTKLKFVRDGKQVTVLPE